MPQQPNFAKQPLATFIFWSRWLQAPLYFGLIMAQGVYGYHFLVELGHLIGTIKTITEEEIMLTVLGLIDVVMIANLLIMVIVGGYETFVSRLQLQGHPDQPEWLSHVNAGVLKVKLATALIGISSIHLLKTFIEVGDMTDGRAAGTETGQSYTWDGVLWQVVIHSVFIQSALALAAIDRMTYHKVTPHEVHDGVPVAYPNARQGLGDDPSDLPEPAPATPRA